MNLIRGAFAHNILPEICNYVNVLKHPILLNDT